VLPRLPDRQPYVYTELVNELCASHVATHFLCLVDATQRTQGGVASLVSRHASLDIGYDSAFNVVAELVVKFLLDLIAAEQRPKADRQCVKQTEQAHVYASFNRTTREIASESRCQIAASRSRARWPARERV